MGIIDPDLFFICWAGLALADTLIETEKRTATHTDTNPEVEKKHRNHNKYEIWSWDLCNNDITKMHVYT